MFNLGIYYPNVKKSETFMHVSDFLLYIFIVILLFLQHHFCGDRE